MSYMCFLFISVCNLFCCLYVCVFVCLSATIMVNKDEYIAVSSPVDGVFVSLEKAVNGGDGGRRRRRGVHRRRRRPRVAGRVRAGQRRHSARGGRVRAVGGRARQSGGGGGRLEREAAGAGAGTGGVVPGGDRRCRRRVVDGTGDAVHRRVVARQFTVVLHAAHTHTSSSSSSSQVFLKWPKQQTPPQVPLQSQSSKQSGSDSVVAATKQISL